MSETARRERDPFALTLAFGLMAAAFAGSYTHVVEATSAWGQRGWMAYAIAAMPEVTVIIGMRRVLTGTMTMIMWVFLASAGVFTLAGNLNSAQHSVFGVIAAAWPAWSAVGALIFAGVHSRGQTTGTGPDPETRTRYVAEAKIGRERVSTPRPRPVVAPAVEVTGGVVGYLESEPEVAPRARFTTLEPTPKAISPTRTPDPETDPVALALAAVWTPGQPLTKEIKAKVIKEAETSESTVKRTARALAGRVEVTR